MLRAFHKQYPSYNLTPLLYKRQQQLIDARAFFPFHTHCTRVQLANVRAGVARPLYWWQSNCQEITVSAQEPSEANDTTKPEPKTPKTQPNNKHTHTHTPTQHGQATEERPGTNKRNNRRNTTQPTDEGTRTKNKQQQRTNDDDDEGRKTARQEPTDRTKNQNQTHKECYISDLATMAISTNYDIASLLVAAGDPRYRRERQHT